MDPSYPTERQLDVWLKCAGIESLCAWDVLVFLFRHQSSLVSAEQIAGFVGHPTGEVVTAVENLEELALVSRSRVDQGVRLYQFTVPGGPRGDALDRLFKLAVHRQGRLLISRWFRSSKPAADRGFQKVDSEKGCAQWLKAI